MTTQRAYSQSGVELVPIEKVISWQDPNVPLERLAVQDAKYIDWLAGKIVLEGLQEPIMVTVRSNGQRVIWDGHHRLIVMRRLRAKTVPVLYKE